MITTTIEKFIDVMDEMKGMNLQHYHEISEHAKHGVLLEPDYQLYLEREQAGDLLTVILRHYGIMVGYYLGFYVRPLHYKGILEHKMDIIFVESTSRGKKGGAMLIEMVKAECQRRGVKALTMGFKEAHKAFMEPLLIERGLMPFERQHIIWFDA